MHGRSPRNHGSRQPRKDWCEEYGVPVGIGVWLVVATGMGYGVPLAGIEASPALLVAVGCMLLLSLTSLALTNLVDPGIIQPRGVDDPIVERLERLERQERQRLDGVGGGGGGGDDYDVEVGVGGDGVGYDGGGGGGGGAGGGGSAGVAPAASGGTTRDSGRG